MCVPDTALGGRLGTTSGHMDMRRAVGKRDLADGPLQLVGILGGTMRLLGQSSEKEMVASFLAGELSSKRFGDAIRAQLAVLGEPEKLLTQPDLADPRENEARANVLAATRGYGQDRELFEFFPSQVQWVRALLAPKELAAVRYIEYSYWNEISDGSRFSSHAARRVKAGMQAFGVSNDRVFDAAAAVARGERFPLLIVAGVALGELVCLEGNLRLTGYALAGFPVEVECLVGTAPTLGRWAR